MTVGAFAVVRDIDHIDQLADDLGSLTETLRASSKPTVTDGLMGVWVENTPAGVRDLTTPPSLYRSDADPAQRDLDWGALARRFPGRVLPLMVQEPSGRLTHDAPTSIEHTYRRSMPLAG